MASAKVNNHLLDRRYAFLSPKVEGVTKCYPNMPLLGLRPEMCVQ